MNNGFFLVYYLAMLVALVTGIIKYKSIDNAMRIIVVLLVATCISEMISYAVTERKEFVIKYMTYHFYSIIEMVLQSLFFIYAIRPRSAQKLIWLTAIAWPLLGILNVLFLQPLDGLNNNMLMLESFATITLSLYFIYWLLKNDKVRNIFTYPHFWIAILWLLFWSSTFFFWAFIKILYSAKWSFINIVVYGQATMNIITVIGIAMVFILYPKNIKAYENS